MGWILFMLLMWFAALVLVPLRYWKKSWPVGVFGLVIIYSIDSTLTHLGAIKFWHGGIYISQLPLYYWISYFPGGIIFDHFRPHKHVPRLLYILIFAALYLFVEVAMVYFGYFQHLNWNALRSYLLNIGGFAISMWFAEWREQG